MKKIKNKKIFVLLTLSFLVLGCDLDLQERFVFVPEIANTGDPFKELTAWQFLTSDRGNLVNEDGTFNGDGFQYFTAAIEAAGMVDEYNGSGTDRTYLLLNNNAFLGNNDVIDIITGSEDVEEGETPAEVMARADLDVLRLVLQYHIIPTFITQTDPLVERDVNFIFQTLIPGEDGIIVMRRDANVRININFAPAPLPSSATGGGNNERVRNHNYLFNNGIGHTLNDPVRNRPYPAPN